MTEGSCTDTLLYLGAFITSSAAVLSAVPQTQAAHRMLNPITIARSLLKKSKVLLADEATSALDADTAFKVTDDILNLSGILRIVITHSLDEILLKRYDEILVLKDGKIEEKGGFDELMAKKGYFYALYTVAH